MSLIASPAQKQAIAATTGDWTRTLPFALYDPAYGALSDVRFTLTGDLSVSASIENLSPAAAVVTLVVPGSITAVSPVGTVGAVTPGVAVNINLGGYDGGTDYAGASGTVLADLSSSQTQTTVFETGAAGGVDLTGSGTFDVTVSGSSRSTVYGNGNLQTLLHAATGAEVTVQFDHQASASDGSGSGSSTSGLVADISFFPYQFFVQNVSTTEPQVVVFPSQTTGWTGAAIVNTFDPALGTLVDVNLSLSNTISGGFAAENLEAAPAGISMTETASVKVLSPSVNLTATATTSDGFTLPGFDGAMDTAGTSGRTDMIADTTAGHSTDSAVLGYNIWAFTGLGSIALPVQSLGQSVVTGPGNLFSQITQQTGATLSVSYVYIPAAHASPAAGPIGASGPHWVVAPHAIIDKPAGSVSPPTYTGEAGGDTFIQTVILPTQPVIPTDPPPVEHSGPQVPEGASGPSAVIARMAIGTVTPLSLNTASLAFIGASLPAPMVQLSQPASIGLIATADFVSGASMPLHDFRVTGVGQAGGLPSGADQPGLPAAGVFLDPSPGLGLPVSPSI